ncbi:TetR/AcrR family transcriptional regulator [Streptomyces niger]|uniref:TetR/AcrR family transcriptional regulator n=1 Tax=Streptomyces niger TaxID=66373 RepID=UPI00069BFFC8|nr:TetR/AcrR family transcriptional regulator [Streptomyces niger]
MTSRKEQREVTRQRVLSAAEQLFTAHGYDATTIRDIAARAGVSVGTVMAVGDKATILVELFDRRISALHETRAKRDAPRRTAPSPGRLADDVLALFEPFLALFAGDPELARHYAAALVTGKHRAGVFNELGAALRREIGDVLIRAGFTPEAAAGGATAIHLAYLGALFVGAGAGGADLSGPVEDLVSVVRFITDSNNAAEGNSNAAEGNS